MSSAQGHTFTSPSSGEGVGGIERQLQQLWNQRRATLTQLALIKQQAQDLHHLAKGTKDQDKRKNDSATRKLTSVFIKLLGARESGQGHGTGPSLRAAAVTPGGSPSYRQGRFQLWSSSRTACGLGHPQRAAGTLPVLQCGQQMPEMHTSTTKTVWAASHTWSHAAWRRSHPRQHWHVDFIGPPPSEEGLKYMFTAMDAATGLLFPHPALTATQDVVIWVLEHLNQCSPVVSQ